MSNNKDKFPNFFANLFIISLLGIMLFSAIILYTVRMSDDVRDMTYMILLDKHVKSNNLNLPLPQFLNLNSIGIDEIEYSKRIDKLFNSSIYEFANSIEKYSLDNDDNYDCKYYAYVWTLWYQENIDKTGFDIEYIDTKNHLFLMFYNESGYCIVDKSSVDCKFIGEQI